MIETERLFIKPLSIDELKKQIVNPNELAQDLGLTLSKSLQEEETQDAIKNFLLPNLENSHKDVLFSTMWIVIDKKEKAMIGGICFHGEPNENGEVEIGYGIDYEYRNKGFMSETIAGLIQWLKNNKKVKAIKAETDTENLSSIKVLEKNNFKISEIIDKSITFHLNLA
jgi:[ribosomal protein S5]-alanine N-acetyltransferase